jgi:putative spermidine/putrescine transport system ATP-binding protein
MSETMIELRGMVKTFGDFVACRGMNLEVQRGELVTLLGPSGCGKTTVLRCITGGLRPDSGQVWIGGQNVTDVPTHKRNIGLVFQNFALFPHLSVLDNVAYPLRVRGVSGAERQRRAMETLTMVGLKGLEDRFPRELSGGQQQRVGLARAVVYQPTVVLLDEPLSNLDAKLRLEMREEIAALKARLGFTAIYVTHDQEEALSLSDRIAVMEGGVVHQIGTPTEVYTAPRTAFVAAFVGNPNRLAGQCVSLQDGRATVQSGRRRLICSTGANAPEAGEAAVVFVRPENIQIADETAADASDTLVARVTRTAFLGDRTEYHVELEDHTQWRLRLEHDHHLAIRETVRLRVSPGTAWAFAHDAAATEVAAAIDPDAAVPEPAQA